MGCCASLVGLSSGLTNKFKLRLKVYNILYKQLVIIPSICCSFSGVLIVVVSAATEEVVTVVVVVIVGDVDCGVAKTINHNKINEF